MAFSYLFPEPQGVPKGGFWKRGMKRQKVPFTLRRFAAVHDTLRHMLACVLSVINLSENIIKRHFGDRAWGFKTYRTLEGGGGELTPKATPRRLGLLTPKLAIFFRIYPERGQFQGPWKLKIFAPSNFRRYSPPYPGLQSLSTT